MWRTWSASHSRSTTGACSRRRRWRRCTGRSSSRGSGRSIPRPRTGLGEPIAHEQALAWFIRTDQAGRRYPSHTGTVKGTRSFLANFDDYGVVVALQTNALPFDSARYGEAIAQMFLP